jgi:hypothetical protein
VCFATLHVTKLWQSWPCRSKWVLRVQVAISSRPAYKTRYNPWGVGFAITERRQITSMSLIESLAPSHSPIFFPISLRLSFSVASRSWTAASPPKRYWHHAFSTSKFAPSLSVIGILLRHVNGKVPSFQTMKLS